jgi:hypothetical protein
MHLEDYGKIDTFSPNKMSSESKHQYIITDNLAKANTKTGSNLLRVFSLMDEGFFDSNTKENNN